jgi:hypothetical protein
MKYSKFTFNIEDAQLDKAFKSYLRMSIWNKMVFYIVFYVFLTLSDLFS